MKLIYAVKDQATDGYGIPMFFQSPGQALRAFTDAVNEPHEKNDLNKHPEDYDIYLVGHYDEDSGRITPTPPTEELERLARCKDLLISRS